MRRGWGGKTAPVMPEIITINLKPAIIADSPFLSWVLRMADK